MEDSRGRHWSDDLEIEKIQDVKITKSVEKPGKNLTKGRLESRLESGLQNSQRPD
jgi:hypothetical protein